MHFKLRSCGLFTLALLVFSCSSPLRTSAGGEAPEGAEVEEVAEPGRLIPSRLRCEYRVDPLGIDVLRPRLSWIVSSRDRVQRQTAYRVLVATSPDSLAGDRGDLWDSGRVSSRETAQVEYEGKPLTSRAHCHWKVRVWDRDGNPSAWSLPALWTMGLLEPADWRAKWIGFDTAELNEDEELLLPPSPYLRKEFRVGGKIQRATVYATALGIFELHLNGRKVGADWFTPGWTSYGHRLHYMTYDVTAALREGANALGGILSNGWYAGYVGFGLLQNRGKAGRAFYGETPALLAQLEVEYENGERQVVATEGTWKASTGPIRKSDLQMGETYDARLEMPGWDAPGFDGPEWKGVTLFEPPECRVEAFPGVPVQATEELETVAITEPAPGVFVFDLGQNFAGCVRLKVEGEAGTEVTLRHAEMLHQDGTIMTENLRKARATDTYILKGSPEPEVWQPRFTYHGFQYVEVAGYPGTPGKDAITGIVLHSDTPRAGSFECSSDLVNRLYRNITWTQRANFVDLPTDCPQRDERLGWTGDAQVYIRSACCNMDVAAFFTKWLVALEDDMRPSGSFADFAPLPYLQNEPSPGWRDAGVICPWTIYRVYGDTRVIERHYGAMERFMDFQRGLCREGTFLVEVKGNCWGDWLATGSKPSPEFLGTAYFAYDAKLMAEMAAAIGRLDDARKYTELLEEIREDFNETYVTPEGKILTPEDNVLVETQTAYAMALYMDLLPPRLRSDAARHLVRLIRENDWHLSTGFLGVRPLLPVLTDEGHADVAFRLLTHTTYPSWGYSVVNGATTIWERWNSYTKDEGFANPAMNSFSHYSFGSVCEWLFASVAGIDTEGPGFYRILIRPHLGGSGITSARATYDSIRGRIVSAWEIEDGRLRLSVTIPANTEATVRVPTIDAEGVTEGGRPTGEAEGVRFVRRTGSYAVFEVGSGDYVFASAVE